MKGVTSTPATRAILGVSALLALVLGYALPGSVVLAGGALWFLLGPLLLRTPVGVAVPLGDATRWVTGPSSALKSDRLIRIIGAYGWLAYAAASLFERDGMMAGVFALLLGNGCLLLALWGLFPRVVQPFDGLEAITLDRATFTVKNASGVQTVPYDEVIDIELASGRLWVSTVSDRIAIDVQGSSEQVLAVADALRAARGRARAAKAEPAESKELERTPGMSVRAWLARIDARIAAARVGPYRGAGFDEEHLWSLFRDDATETAVRVAAARVLAASSSEEVRLRVAGSVKEITDEPTRVRVELAMRPDADEAAAELESLELAELRRSAGV